MRPHALDAILDWQTRIQHSPATDLTRTPALLREAARDVGRGHHASIVTVRRLSSFSPSDPLSGWRPIGVHRAPPPDAGEDDAAVERRIGELLQRGSLDAYAQDPFVRANVAGAGTPRVICRRRCAPAPGAAEGIDALLESVGCVDEAICAWPVAPHLEAHLLVRRCGEQPPFDDEDLELLSRLLHAVAVPLARVARSHTWRLGDDALTPRQQDVLSLLLSSDSEKAMADALGLSPRTVHGYVTDVYRKLGVKSRAELMARWIEPLARDTGSV